MHVTPTQTPIVMRVVDSIPGGHGSTENRAAVDEDVSVAVRVGGRLGTTLPRPRAFDLPHSQSGRRITLMWVTGSLSPWSEDLHDRVCLEQWLTCKQQAKERYICSG